MNSSTSRGRPVSKKLVAIHTADSIGSRISSFRLGICSSLACSELISADGLKARSSPFSRKLVMNETFSRSAPAALSLGLSVSYRPSSSDQTTTRPLGAFSPSGEVPPWLIVAVIFGAIVVLPFPGDPASK